MSLRPFWHNTVNIPGNPWLTSCLVAYQLRRFPTQTRGFPMTLQLQPCEVSVTLHPTPWGLRIAWIHTQGYLQIPMSTHLFGFGFGLQFVEFLSARWYMSSVHQHYSHFIITWKLFCSGAHSRTLYCGGPSSYDDNLGHFKYCGWLVGWLVCRHWQVWWMMCWYRWHADQAVGLGEEVDLYAGVWGSHALRHADRHQPQGQQHLRQLLSWQNCQGCPSRCPLLTHTQFSSSAMIVTFSKEVMFL